MLEMPLDRTSRVPLHRQVSDHIRRLISSGALPPGSRLPSFREMSSSLKVSRITVEEAYSELEAEHLICLVPRKGVFVAQDRPVSLSQRWRGGVGEESESVDLCSDRACSELMPSGEVARAIRGLGMEAKVHRPASLAGLEELRAALVGHCALRGVPAVKEQLVVTSGGREGLFLCLWSLRKAGVSRLWVESLTYPTAFLQASELGLTVIPFRSLEELDRARVGDAVYLVPSFHNPTGRVMGLRDRSLALEMSRTRGFRILEDDTYGELRYGPRSVPALKAMDHLGEVLYLGSFSRGLFLDFKLGYLLCPGSLMDHVMLAKANFFGETNPLSQELALNLFEDGAVPRILERNRHLVRVRMESLCGTLGIPMPEGGIFAWLEISRGGSAFSERLAELGVKVAPGAGFSPVGEDVRGVRLSACAVGARELREAIGVIRRVLDDEAW